MVQAAVEGVARRGVRRALQGLYATNFAIFEHAEVDVVILVLVTGIGETRGGEVHRMSTLSGINTNSNIATSQTVE